MSLLLYIEKKEKIKLHFYPDKPVSWSLTWEKSVVFLSFPMYISLYFNVLSTVLRQNQNTDFLVFIVIYEHVYKHQKDVLTFLRD